MTTLTFGVVLSPDTSKWLGTMLFYPTTRDARMVCRKARSTVSNGHSWSQP
jgi:hypothetical protein